MKPIGLVYGISTVKTASVAQKIQTAFGKTKVEIISVEQAWQNDFMAYENLIVGTSTWFDGELPHYWDELRPELSGLKLNGKKVAIFGLGDQAKYPENFVDGIGILADIFKTCGAVLVGYTSPKGYTFIRSVALENDKLQGLVIDFENQPDKTDIRIKDWVAQLQKEFD